MRPAHERRRGILARIRAIEALLVGEQHQYIRLNEVGDQRAERVVVAEADFIGRHGVVLVDDRDHAESEQCNERGTRVEISPPVGKIVVREQNLRGVQPEMRESGFVGLHQAHLSDRGRGLQCVDGVRPPRPTEALHAFGNRA